MGRSRNLIENKGFTLIELLVVISIIALLLSIVMPSLRKAKESAKLVVCLSSTKQLGIAALLYTTDNDDSFHVGYTGAETLPKDMWPEALRNYYDTPDSRVCVSTKWPLYDSMGSSTNDRLLGDPFGMWGIWPKTEYWYTKGDYGSFGFNAWLNNPPAQFDTIAGLFDTKNHFRKVTKVNSNTGNVPVFVDSWWVQGYPDSSGNGAKAPEFDGDVGFTGHEMKRYCVNRHNGRVNATFLDGSSRTIKLKKLWGLKWHRNFETSAQYHPDVEPWPDWMEGFSD